MVKDTIVLEGRVVSGLGVGAKYVSIYRDVFKRYLGIDPYPGTLNIDLGRDVSSVLASIYGKLIPPPGNGFLPVIAYRGSINGIKVYIVRPCKTDHGWNIIELVSTINLREKLGLKDGDRIKIIVYTTP